MAEPVNNAAQETDDYSDWEVVTPSSPDADTDYSAWEMAEMTGGGMPSSEVMMQQGMAGAVEGSTGLTGMIAGAKFGAQVPGGPAVKAVTTFTGGVAGLMFGGMTGNKFLELLGVPQPEQLPESQRPAAYGARSLGGAAPFILAPYAAGAMNLKVADQGVGKLVNRIINTAKTRPVSTGLAEGTAAVSAAGMSAVAESIWPGETGVRIGAEVVGGIVNPAAPTMRAFGALYNQGRKWVTTAKATETRAAQSLQEMFEVSNEDPSLLIRVLQEQGVMDENRAIIDEGLTLAQQTGSETLAALQNYLIKSDPAFSESVKKNTMDSLDAMRGIIAQLSKTGDPEALTVAAKAKSVYVRSLLQSMVDGATENAVSTAARISDDTPDARAVLSANARESLGNVIGEVRKAENQLWGAVPNDTPANVINLRVKNEQIRGEITPVLRDKEMPKIVSDFIEWSEKGLPGESLLVIPDHLRPEFTAPKVNTTVGDLKQMRSKLLDMAREASNSGNYSQARTYNDLAEAALDDIDAAFTNINDEAYQNARRFSKEMNDVFTRSFVGKATATGKYGDRVAPELLLRKALATGKEAADLNFQQLEEATRFLEVRGMGNEITQEATKVMMDGQERFVRLMFAEAINPTTMQVNTSKLAEKMRQNKALLNRFPEVAEVLKSAMVSETKRKTVEDYVKGTTAFIRQSKAFEKLAKGDPVVIAGQMLESPNMDRQMQDMINVIKGSKLTGANAQEAKAGLSAAIHSAALRKARDSRGNMDLTKYRNLMTNPSVPGGDNALDLMLKKKVIDKDHHDAITRIFDIMDNIETASIPGVIVEPVKGLSDTVMKFFARVAGSTAVRSASKVMGSGGATIQATGAGANMAEYLSTKMSKVNMDDVFIRALNDKDFLIELLQKIDTPQQAETQALRINAWLHQATIDMVTPGEEEQQ
jgi:hypothetical protein